jgi:hypothetical protein
MSAPFPRGGFPLHPQYDEAMVVSMIEKNDCLYPVDNEDCEELYPNDVQIVLGRPI